MVVLPLTAVHYLTLCLPTTLHSIGGADASPHMHSRVVPPVLLTVLSPEVFPFLEEYFFTCKMLVNY